MPTNTKGEYSVVLKFGGGVHSKASEDEINDRECAAGQNFQLDIQNREYKPRAAFDLIGTVPNASEIRGAANLIKSDGSVSMLVQAGDTVYQWDGSTFTSKGTVSSTAKLRGHLWHNWQLDDKVLITDLNLQEPVMQWDGTTLSDVQFTKNTGGTDLWVGSFKAKYCVVSNERALFGNINDNSVNYPHLLVASTRGDFDLISVADRPSSAMSAEDPFFLIQPDYRAINGMLESFGKVITSSQHFGSMFYLSGSDATDFAFTELYPRSGAYGGESVVYTGNDIMYGRQGRIESLLSSEKFADVESDDLSVGISNLIEDFDNWMAVYNSRFQRVYFCPVGEEQLWVYHKALAGSDISPWSKWVTSHELKFNPTLIMNMIDPADGLEYVFLGDSAGRFYRLEGTSTGDAGTHNIRVERLSKLFKLPLDSQAFNLHGWITYRRNQAATVTLRFEASGENVFNETIQLSLPAVSGGMYWGGSYWGGSYWGQQFANRLTRQKFGIAQKSNEFQVRVTIEGVNDWAINEIGFRFEAAS